MNIGFFVRHFTERGTEVAIYDYANHNELILKNKTFIICFNEQAQQRYGLFAERHSFDKFSKRFQIIEINDIKEMTDVIKKLDIKFFYTLTHGGGNDIYQFDNKQLWGDCKTIKHCVFNTTYPESDFYIGIADFLNKKYNTNVPVIPHIVDLPSTDENLRNELNIPEDAVVFGRHGGMYEFNINIAHEAIKEYLKHNENSYFLFMNTSRFYEHPKIIYLERNVDLEYKARFINTCDAMIHARFCGEIFPMSIAEFSIKNKAVITCPIGDLGHIQILGEKAILYHSAEQLVDIFKNIKVIIHSRSDWNAHRLYSPEYVMGLFNTHIFDNVR
jgi:hypothetical protein